MSGRRRFLERIPSIRAKLGFVIVFAVLGYLGKPIGYLPERNEQGTGDAHLVALPSFAHIDQHSTPVAHGGVCVFRGRVDLDRHRASIRSSSDQPC